jgi:hypothetical protein
MSRVYEAELRSEERRIHACFRSSKREKRYRDWSAGQARVSSLLLRVDSNLEGRRAWTDMART